MSLRCKLTVAVILAGCSWTPLWAQQPFDAKAYLRTAIETVRDNALFSDRVHWSEVSAQVHAQGDGARDVFDTYPALVTLVRALGDHHSFLQLSAERAAAYERAKGHPFHYPPDQSRPRELDRTFVGRTGATPSDHVVDGMRIRTLVVTGNSDNSPEAMQRYAMDLHRAVVAGPRACGYVVDLRGSTGGNMTPMIAGLGTLLGNREVGGTAAREGAEMWVVRDARFLFRSAAGKEQLALRIPGWRPLPGGASRPVAILIDGGTASSGEITAISFAGRADTRVFGTHSLGVSTSTSGFLLPDGTNLVLVDAEVQDRYGRHYPDGIAPDVSINGTEAEKRATAWVASRCAERAR